MTVLFTALQEGQENAYSYGGTASLSGAGPTDHHLPDRSEG